jgi:hypothetical protein
VGVEAEPPLTHSTVFERVDAQAAAAVRSGPQLVGPLHVSVVDMPCGKKMGSGLRRSRKKPSQLTTPRSRSMSARPPTGGHA